MENIHIGELLSNYFDREHINKSEFSRKTGIGYQSLLKDLKKGTLSVAILLKYSQALEHNFFMDITPQLPKTYTTDAPIDATATNEIEDLKEKIKFLEAEKKLLLQVIGVKG